MESFSGWVEVRPGFAPRPQISHVVIDFDGTLSWLRHGWPELMCEIFEVYLPASTIEPCREIRELLLDDRFHPVPSLLSIREIQVPI